MVHIRASYLLTCMFSAAGGGWRRAFTDCTSKVLFLRGREIILGVMALATEMSRLTLSQPFKIGPGGGVLLERGCSRWFNWLSDSLVAVVAVATSWSNPGSSRLYRLEGGILRRTLKRIAWRDRVYGAAADTKSHAQARLTYMRVQKDSEWVMSLRGYHAPVLFIRKPGKTRTKNGTIHALMTIPNTTDFLLLLLLLLLTFVPTQTETCGGFDSFDLYRLAPALTCSTPVEPYEQVCMFPSHPIPYSSHLCFGLSKGLVLPGYWLSPVVPTSPQLVWCLLHGDVVLFPKIMPQRRLQLCVQQVFSTSRLYPRNFKRELTSLHLA